MWSGQWLPPFHTYMDGMTTLTSTMPRTNRLLGKLHANITWARMKFEPSKSRSESIIRGLADQRFYIDETAIPMLSELPVKSLGWCYKAFEIKVLGKSIQVLILKGNKIQIKSAKNFLLL